MCLQGGIPSRLRWQLLRHVVRAVHKAVPGMHINGFTALEVPEAAGGSGSHSRSTCGGCRRWDLRLCRGTAAQILDDEIRAVLCPDKISIEECLEVHCTSPGVGLRSNMTMVFRAIERPEHWGSPHAACAGTAARDGRLHRVCGPAVRPHGRADLPHGAGAAGTDVCETVLVHAVARIAFRATSPTCRPPGITLGTDGVRQMLAAGSNDLGAP